MTTYADRIPGYIVQIPDDPRTNRDPNRCVDYYILDTASKLLYIWPERLHQRRPTQAEIDEAKGKSNNQFRKLMEKYNKTNIKVGVYVDFEVVDDRLRTVKNVEVRGNNPGQYHCRNSEDVVSCNAVIGCTRHLRAKVQVSLNLAEDRLRREARSSAIVLLSGLFRSSRSGCGPATAIASGRAFQRLPYITTRFRTAGSASTASRSGPQQNGCSQQVA